MSKIKNIVAREILDSRGLPTIETKVYTENGVVGMFSVPSGASKGEREALELRDGDKNRYNGNGVLNAVKNVNTIIKDNLMGIEISSQKEIDSMLTELDGTSNKSNLGANALLSVSIACLRAAALEHNETLYNYLNKKEKKLPYGMFNIVNGGKHAFNNLDIQEFMIVPKFPKFSKTIECVSEVFYALKKILEEKELSTSVGDEGGFAPNLKSNKEALDVIVEAIKKANYTPGKEVFLAMDVAASSFYDKKEKKYNLDNKLITREELLDYYTELLQDYPIISIEDPFDENDYEGFKLITEKLGKKISIVGDDLFVTNKELLKKGIEKGLCNAILIKPNQIGTFYEMLETIVLAKQNKYITILSHRSGETTDPFIAEAVVALNMPFIKAGSITRGERIAKYNKLLEIEEELEQYK